MDETDNNNNKLRAIALFVRSMLMWMTRVIWFMAHDQN